MTRQTLGIAVIALAIAARPAAAAVHTATVRVGVPGYQVSQLAGLDEVTIPQGQLLATEPGRPVVPYYTEQVEYPAGTRIQDVKLSNRQGLKTDSGLRLPAAGEDTIALDFEEMTPGQYPKQEFTWDQLEDPDKTILLLHVFPFIYDPRTTRVEFYTEYEFEVRHVQTGVSIASLDLDPPACDPGESIAVRAVLENSGAPVDVRLLGAVCHGATSAAELPARDIKGLGPIDTVSLELLTRRLPAGEYLVRVTAADLEGSELARAEEPFLLGVPRGEVTGFSVKPRVFKPGVDVKLELAFTNSGRSELSGECVFRIYKADRVVDELSQDLAGLKPGGSRTFRMAWSTAGAEKGAVYRAVGFVRYDGTASEHRSVEFSTNAMPEPSLSFTPDSAVVGIDVEFDAAGSKDEDGEIVEYRWEFGDGGTATGVNATHAWMQPGDFTVRLTVVDNEGGTGAAEQTVVVTEEQ